MTEIFEIIMLLCFGASWPFNVMKSYRARTATGKSPVFLCLVLIGYVAGVVSKLTAPSFKWYVMFFYILNFSMVFVDLMLYLRNRRLDAAREKAEQ